MNNNKLEPTWTYQGKILLLEDKIKDAQKEVEGKIKSSEQTCFKAIGMIKADILNDISAKTGDLNTLKEQLVSENQKCMKDLQEFTNSELNTMSSNLESKFENEQKTMLNLKAQIEAHNKNQLENFAIKLNTLEKTNENKLKTISNSVVDANNKLNKIQFDIIDNEDNVAITYVNPKGKSEYVAFRKTIPDEKTLTYEKDKKFIKLKYTFDKDDLQVKNDVVSVKGFTLSSGKHLSADRINNDLSNATYNISDLTYKLENVIKRLNNSNGYLASNNFKTAEPLQDSLTNFAISRLSNKNTTITKDQLPSGTKIKNTFDNHIWVLNRISINGLTTYKWEDYGSDAICIANNKGIHGLVTGSQEKLRGYVDINGVISINGLEEELTSILESMLNINNSLKEYQEEINNKFDNILERLSNLEK